MLLPYLPLWVVSYYLSLALRIFKAHKSINLYNLPIHTSSFGVGVIAAMIELTVTTAVTMPTIFTKKSISPPLLVS